jgi:hypothetical protein
VGGALGSGKALELANQEVRRLVHDALKQIGEQWATVKIGEVSQFSGVSK